MDIINSIGVGSIDTTHPHLANGKVWLIATDRETGAVVGVCSLEQQSIDWAWISDLFVVETHRRRGIARALVRNAWLKAFNLPKVVGVSAGTDRDNVASLRLFRDLGYRHSYTYPDNNALMMSMSTRD
jgi:RimJ/RimL family protein N-acetyltransferase